MRIATLTLLLLLTAAAPGSERRFMVSGFDRVRVDGPFEVEIGPGSSSASAEASPAALERLSMRVAGSTLIINSGTAGWKPTAVTAEATKIRITAPLLRGIFANGGGKVRVSEMHAASVDLALDGAGSLDIAGIRADALNAGHNGTGVLTLAGTAGRVRIRGAGTGTIDAAGFLADDATLFWESSGPLAIGVRYTAQIIASGKGAVTILGKPVCAIRGTAPVTCHGTQPR